MRERLCRIFGRTVILYLDLITWARIDKDCTSSSKLAVWLPVCMYVYVVQYSICSSCSLEMISHTSVSHLQYIQLENTTKRAPDPILMHLLACSYTLTGGCQDIHIKNIVVLKLVSRSKVMLATLKFIPR